jgi:hypothetical protein
VCSVDWSRSSEPFKLPAAWLAVVAAFVLALFSFSSQRSNFALSAFALAAFCAWNKQFLYGYEGLLK